MSLSAEVSPCKANSEAADEPNEDAASKAGSDPDYDPFADCDSESPLTVSSFPESDMITDSVLQEEVTLEKQAETEEEEKIQHQKQLWLTLGEETKEQRYQRLQCLLMKSNMYTEYLMKRMERQREEETKRRRRIIKKREAEAKAKVEAVPAKTEHPSTADTNTGNNVSPSSEIRTQSQENQVLGSPSASQNLNEADENQSSQNSTSSTSSTRRRSKRCLPAPVPKSRLSTNNTPVSSPKVPKSPSPNLPSNKVKSEPQSESSETLSLKDPSLSPTSDKENVDGNTKKDVQDASENEDKKINFTEETAATRAVWNVLGKQAENYKRKVDQVDTDELLKQILPPKKARKSEPEIPLFNGDPDIDEDGTIVRPALLTGGNLRKYQIEGLNWLKVLFENGVNGMLADEMGLGKTIQCVALLCQIITMGATGPFMVVAPLSTLPNWKMEFKRFAPHLPVVFYHGSKDERTLLQKTIKKRHLIMKGVKIQPIVITSYEIAMKDRPDLQKFNWTYLIVDEGHRIKNKNCRLVRELKCYKNSHRLLLTGTPLQNNLSELWSLLNFLLPEIFDDLGSFETWFDVEMFSADGANEAIIEEEQQKNVLSMLHQILTPFMLRRVKSDVDLEIPPKKELLVYAPLSQVQKEFYETTLDKSIFEKFNPEEEEPEVELNASGRPKRGGRILNRKPDHSLEQNTEVKLTLNNIMMQLRKVCNHPYLIEYPLDPFGNYKMDEDLVDKCGKMMVLDKMVPELRQRGHKILIFSQMTKMMDILEDYLCIRKMKYCRLDGSCKIQDRQESMEKFNTDPEIGVFLLSTRAGGLGVNLVAADTVIIYDSDWNPQCDLQAQDRCHRIGQTKPVVVYRFVTANTVDEKIVERAAGKRKLEKVIIHKGKFKSGINKEFTSEVKPLNPEELLELLKSTDHSAIVHKGKDEAISNQELDELLDRSDLIAEFEASRKEAKSKKN